MIKFNNFIYTIKSSALLLIAGALFSCGGATAPARKKMPEFNSLSDGIEGPGTGWGNTNQMQGSFAFAPTNIDLAMSDGTVHGFVSVPLPNPANDSAAVSLINSVKPFALPMLSAWAHQQRNGVMLDLSSHALPVSRTDYVMEKPGEYNIPLVVLWDARSAYRVAIVKNLIAAEPALRLRQTSGNSVSQN